MKKFVFFLIILESILPIACGDSLTSIGDPKEQAYLAILNGSSTPAGPRVTSTSPADGSTNTGTSAIITATFSEEIKCSSVTAASFLLYDNGIPVSGTVDCYGTTAAFTPSAKLDIAKKYDATVTAAVQNLENRSMAADHAWSFTVESGPTLEQKLRGIWVIGGADTISGATIVREVDLYDPITDTWYPDVAAEATGSYIPTAYGTAVYMSGKIYVMGGAINSAAGLNLVQVYDIATNSWSAKTNIPAVRVGAASYANGRYIYILSGSTTLSTANGSNLHYRYNSSDNMWDTTPPPVPANNPSAGRVGLGVFNFNGSVSFAGGKSTSGATQYTNYIYNVPSNSFMAARSLIVSGTNRPRSFMASSGHSGGNGVFFFLAGGVSATTSATAFFGFTAYTFVPQASSFIVYLPPSTAVNAVLVGTNCPSFGAATTTGVAFHAGAVSPYNGSSVEDPTFYILGGIKNDGTGVAITTDVSAISASGAVDLTTSPPSYITASGWVTKSPMPRARFGHSAVVAEP